MEHVDKFSREAGHPFPRHDRIFDLVQGILIEDHYVDGDGTTITRLKDTRPMEPSVLARRKEQLEKALNKDAFKVEICRPWLSSKSHAYRKSAFLSLMHLADQKMMAELFSEFVTACEGAKVFAMCVESFFHEALYKTTPWAIDVLLDKEWKPLVEYGWVSAHGALKDLAGMDLGKREEDWDPWFQRVRGALPDVESLETAALEPRKDHEDPWVRDFVRGVLAVRNRVENETAKRENDEREKHAP